MHRHRIYHSEDAELFDHSDDDVVELSYSMFTTTV